MNRNKFAVFYSIRFLQSILAIIGNSTTIISIAKFENLQTSTHIFIAGLAMADLLGGLVLTPLGLFTDLAQIEAVDQMPSILEDNTEDYQPTSNFTTTIAVDNYNNTIIQYRIQ